MHRSRQLLAIVLLWSALACDGTVRAASLQRDDASPSATSYAGRLVQQLSAGFRRSISARFVRCIGRQAVVVAASPIPTHVLVLSDTRPEVLSFAQYRLPPPIV